MHRKVASLTLGLVAAGLLSAPIAAAAPGDAAANNGSDKSVSANARAGAAVKEARTAIKEARAAARENRAAVGRAVSEAAKSGGGSVAVLTALSQLKPENTGIAKALAEALARLNPPPVDPAPAP